MKHDTRWSSPHDAPRRLGLPSALSGATCALLLTASIDPVVGDEIIIALLAASVAEARELADAAPLRVGAVCGVLPTSSGPLLSTLWTVADPRGGWEPLAVHQALDDPSDATALGPLRRLASQSHWHVAIVGPDLDVHRWAQLDNRFGLGEALEGCVELARPLGPTDVHAARLEAAARWTPLDVLAAHDPPRPAAGRSLVDDLVALLAHAVARDDRAAARAVGQIAHRRGGTPAMDLVLETYREGLRPPRTARARTAARWWNGVGGWRA